MQFKFMHFREAEKRHGMFEVKYLLSFIQIKRHSLSIITVYLVQL